MRISDWSSDVCSSDLTDGVVAEIPREAIRYAHTPQGEYVLFGDFCSIGEHEIDLMLTDEGTDTVTIQTCHGQVIMIEPNSHLTASVLPLTFRSDARRAGQEYVRPCRSRWWPSHKTTKHIFIMLQ